MTMPSLSASSRAPWPHAASKWPAPHSSQEALVRCADFQPRFIVLDLKLGAESGLALIPRLIAARPGVRILLLTGYASIATAVEAIKRGAHDYLAKPVDADQVVQALLGPSSHRSQRRVADRMRRRR